MGNPIATSQESSLIQTILSVSELHRIMRCRSRTVTAGREFHPALKISVIIHAPALLYQDRMEIQALFFYNLFKIIIIKYY